MAWCAGAEQAGQGAPVPASRCAHSRQNRLWPHGTSAAATPRSAHTAQARAGEAAGDGRVGPHAHTPAVPPPGDSNDGDSPSPSSRSVDDQMPSRSPSRADEPPDEHEPAEEKAASCSGRSSDASPARYSVASGSLSVVAGTPAPAAPAAPVRSAMCASISLRAASTLSGRPVTSNTGSRSRDGVTMYVCVVCWIRLMVAPLGPTTSPTTR